MPGDRPGWQFGPGGMRPGPGPDRGGPGMEGPGRNMGPGPGQGPGRNGSYGRPPRRDDHDSGDAAAAMIGILLLGAIISNTAGNSCSY